MINKQILAHPLAGSLCRTRTVRKVLLSLLLAAPLLVPVARAFAAPLNPNPAVCSFLTSDIWVYCGVDYNGAQSQAFIQSIHTANSDYHHNFHMQYWNSFTVSWYDERNWHLYFDGEIDGGFGGPVYQFRVYDSVYGSPSKLFLISLAQCPQAPGDIYLCAKTASDNFIDYFYTGAYTTNFPSFRTALNTKSTGRWGTLPNAFCNVVHQKHVNLGWTADCTVR